MKDGFLKEDSLYQKMFPIILISTNKKQAEEYLGHFIKINQFSPSYIFHYYPEGKVIKISQIREIQRLLIREDKTRKLIIIHDFDTAKVEAQNAFLKTLEEKNEKAQFIMIIGNETQVLPTILSRCKIIKLKSLTSNSPLMFDHSLFPQSPSHLLLKYSNTKKEKAVKICDELLWFFRKLLISDISLERTTFIIKIIKEILKVRTFLLRNNLNSQIAIDHLLIFIYNCYNYYNDEKN